MTPASDDPPTEQGSAEPARAASDTPIESPRPPEAPPLDPSNAEGNAHPGTVSAEDQPRKRRRRRRRRGPRPEGVAAAAAGEGREGAMADVPQPQDDLSPHEGDAASAAQPDGEPGPENPALPGAAPPEDQPRKRRRRRRRKGPRPAPAETVLAGGEGQDTESAATPDDSTDSLPTATAPGEEVLAETGAASVTPSGDQPRRRPRRRRRKPPAALAGEAAASPGEGQIGLHSDAPPSPDGAAREQRPPRDRGPRERRDRGPRPPGAPEPRSHEGGPREPSSRDRGPRSDRPREDRPRGDGPRRDGPRRDGPRRDGPRGPGNRPRGGDRDAPRRPPERTLYSFESVVDRGFEEVPDAENEGATKRVDWTIVKRTVADRNSAKLVSAVYVLRRDGSETEFSNLAASRAAVNKAIVHPEKLTKAKSDYASTKK